ncbi:TVP38/TMEM64 family protein [Pseudalkalibacillus decolorationis]|uniref:TVP38/TMEM64 family protein n=1 Tax=Pseudalkalibacillus decolorationis TaxID=163879 RepID=UPI00214841A0|nr:VTT domain-containing protein [Pseudalkalibacillus decolorationis]
MNDTILWFFDEYSSVSVFISLFISILISIVGIVPSFFITAANITFFGIWYGLLFSFLGEALGAIVSFILYRKGFKRFSQNIDSTKFPQVAKLLKVDGMEAFQLILALRLFPFVPSGTITIFAALGKVSLPLFTLASTVGKIPALIIEAYSVVQINEFDWEGKLLLTLISLYLLITVLKKIRKQ